jgi:hypothetical protein
MIFLPSSLLVSPAHVAKAAAKRLVQARTVREGKPVSGLN